TPWDRAPAPACRPAASLRAVAARASARASRSTRKAASTDRPRQAGKTKAPAAQERSQAAARPAPTAAATRPKPRSTRVLRRPRRTPRDALRLQLRDRLPLQAVIDDHPERQQCEHDKRRDVGGDDESRVLAQFHQRASAAASNRNVRTR